MNDSNFSLKVYIQILSHCCREYQNIENTMSQLIYFINTRERQYRFSEDELQSFKFLEAIISANKVEIQNTYRFFEEDKQKVEQEINAKINCDCASPLLDILTNFDIKEWWEQAYPIIEHISTITGAITGVAAITTAPIAFINWMRSRLQKNRNKSEYEWIKSILEKDEWNVSILAEKLYLSEGDTEQLLKGFGYIWDANQMMYVATESTYKLRAIKRTKKLF